MPSGQLSHWDQPSAAMEDAYLEFSRHVSLLKQSLFRQNIVSFVQEEQARKLDLSVQLVKKGILWISFHRKEFCGSGRRQVKLLLWIAFWSSIFNKDIFSLEQCVDALWDLKGRGCLSVVPMFWKLQNFFGACWLHAVVYLGQHLNVFVYLLPGLFSWQKLVGVCQNGVQLYVNI